MMCISNQLSDYVPNDTANWLRFQFYLGIATSTNNFHFSGPTYSHTTTKDCLEKICFLQPFMERAMLKSVIHITKIYPEFANSFPYLLLLSGR